MIKEAHMKASDYCDKCNKIQALNTLGQHKKCTVYDKIMTPQYDTIAMGNGLGIFPKLKECKHEAKEESQESGDKTERLRSAPIRKEGLQTPGKRE